MYFDDVILKLRSRGIARDGTFIGPTYVPFAYDGIAESPDSFLSR